MFRRNYLTLLFAAAVILTGSIASYAQSGLARGVIMLKKADGTTTPLADVVIDVYRTDIKGKLDPNKTNKKGEFTILGLLPGARYALAVSAPNIIGDAFPDIKAGDERLTLTVVEGKGNRLTEDEVRQMLANAKPTGELTAEQKKQQEEQAKQQAKYEAEKKNVDKINEVVKKAETQGNKAFGEENYDLAISSYDEGINVDPDFEGSAPFLLNNKALALVKRASNKYNAAVRGDASAKAPALELVKKDLADSMAASTKSLQILGTAKNTDAKVQKAYAAEKIRAYENTINVYGKMFFMNVDTTKAKEALAALEQYSAVEADATKKSQVQMGLADGFRQAGEAQNAIIVYRKVIEISPDNPDALAGLGLSLFNVGASTVPANTAQMQEGLNLMQRFSEIAPDSHPLKASVKEAVEYLKSQQLTPQKTSKPAKKKT